MADLFITTQGAQVSKSGDTLVIIKGERVVFETPARFVDTLALVGNVQLSAQALKLLLRQGIDVVYLDTRLRLIGRVSPPLGLNNTLRAQQYAAVANKPLAHAFSREIVRLKFASSLQLLQEARRNKPNLPPIPPVLFALQKKLDRVSSPEALRGSEGVFAKHYFEFYRLLFPDEALFRGRTRRPPKDPGNAILSLTAVLTMNRIAALLEATGLDPYFGFLHGHDYGRLSLAADLVEPLRPAFCERLTVKCFSLKVLQPDDFESRDGGYYLTNEGSKKFFRYFNDEFHSERKYHAEAVTAAEYCAQLVAWAKMTVNSQNSTAFTDYLATATPASKPIFADDDD